jgi:hypothetical protein
MQINNEASATTTTTTAPAGTDGTIQATTTTPASGEAGQGQGQTETGTTNTTSSTTAEGQDEQGKQQGNADDANGETPRDDQGRFKSPKLQKRIDELTHARHSAEREAAHWRAIAEGRKTDPAPQAHEYASDEAYEAAVRQHEVRQAARQEVAETANATADRFQQDAARAIDATYNERVTAAVARIPDFIDVVGKVDIQITHDMLAAIKESEHGPDITYQLAQNPEQAARMVQMSTAQMYRELGRMEAAIEAKGGTAAPAPAAAHAPAARTTNAPAPASTGAPAGAAPANTDPAKMPQAEYEAWRKANGAKYFR